jgi:hypothetical protein
VTNLSSIDLSCQILCCYRPSGYGSNQGIKSTAACINLVVKSGSLFSRILDNIPVSFAASYGNESTVKKGRKPSRIGALIFTKLLDLVH